MTSRDDNRASSVRSWLGALGAHHFRRHSWTSNWFYFVTAALLSAFIGSWVPQLSAPFRAVVGSVTGAKPTQSDVAAKKGGDGGLCRKFCLWTRWACE
jgi:hypothetical protein